ncbi:MAG: ribonuclease P protein subunit [Nanoarchaeota archaeon]
MQKNNKYDLSFKKKVEFNILFESLIGKEIEIIDSTNKNLIGIKGILIYESFNLLYVDTNGIVKKILKNVVVLKIKYENQYLKVNGEVLKGTLITRLKKIK